MCPESELALFQDTKCEKERIFPNGWGVENAFQGRLGSLTLAERIPAARNSAYHASI